MGWDVRGLAQCPLSSHLLSLNPHPTPLPAPLPGRFLEEELAGRYRDAAPATLALLQERCESVARELIAADKKLQEAGDVASLRKAGAFLGCVRATACSRGGWVLRQNSQAGAGHRGQLLATSPQFTPPNPSIHLAQPSSMCWTLQGRCRPSWRAPLPSTPWPLAGPQRRSGRRPRAAT